MSKKKIIEALTKIVENEGIYSGPTVFGMIKDLINDLEKEVNNETY